MSLREKLQVMVVDDMATSRSLILQSLESFGLQNVQWAADGKGAMTGLSKKPAHLVISDFNMPGMSGLELLAALRKSERMAKVGFILITGRPDQNMVDLGRKLGMNNFVKKPFEAKDLLKAIEAVVGRL